MKYDDPMRLEFLKKLDNYSRSLFCATLLYKWKRDFSFTMILASILLPMTCVLFLHLSYYWTWLSIALAAYNGIRMHLNYKKLDSVRSLLKNAHVIESIETLDAMQELVNRKYMSAK